MKRKPHTLDLVNCWIVEGAKAVGIVGCLIILGLWLGVLR